MFYETSCMSNHVPPLLYLPPPNPSSHPLRIFPLSHSTAGPCPGGVQTSYLPVYETFRGGKLFVLTTYNLPLCAQTSYLPCMSSSPFSCRGVESPGGAISGLPAHAYDMYIMPPSPMTPMMHSQSGQQQRQQQLQQSTPRMRHEQLNSQGMHTLMPMYIVHLTMLI